MVRERQQKGGNGQERGGRGRQREAREGLRVEKEKQQERRDHTLCVAAPLPTPPARI